MDSGAISFIDKFVRRIRVLVCERFPLCSSATASRLPLNVTYCLAYAVVWY